MKKILGILVIAGSLVACNDNANSTENKVDSADSAAKAQKEVVDSNAAAQKEAIDSNKNAVIDTLKAKGDSANAHK